MLHLRSFIYTVLLFGSAVPCALWCCVAWPFGYERALRGAIAYARFNLWCLRVLCDLDYRVEGLEHIPRDRAVICYMKHTSAWETLAQLAIFPAQSWVLKRELMWIPIFGRSASRIRRKSTEPSRAITNLLNMCRDVARNTRRPPGTHVRVSNLNENWNVIAGRGISCNRRTGIQRE